MAKKKSFKQQVKDHLNRDEKDIQDELVDDKVDQYIIDCNTTVGLITIKEIPEYGGKIKIEEGKLKTSKKELVKAKLELKSNFSEWVNHIKNCESRVSMHEANIVQYNANIESAEAEVVRLEGLLEILKS